MVKKLQDNLKKNGRLEIVDGIVKKAFYPEDEEEKINSSVTFEQLANFVWFSATKTPLKLRNLPLLGVHESKAIYFCMMKFQAINGLEMEILTVLF